MTPATFLKGFSVLALFLLSSANPIKSHLFEKRGPTCYNLTIPTTISASNANISPNLDVSNADSFADALANLVFDVAVVGQFCIFARYCEPEIQNVDRSNTLQILVHGATYDRNFCKSSEVFDLPSVVIKRRTVS